MGLFNNSGCMQIWLFRNPFKKIFWWRAGETNLFGFKYTWMMPENISWLLSGCRIISANPYINSKTEVKGFNARKHFYKIIDVWDSGWNDELGTVPPENVNRIALNIIKQFAHVQKRFIIHYLQPHFPYISKNFKTVGFS